MFYIVRNTEILFTVETEAEASQIINEDLTGELEYYPEEARIIYE